MSKAKHPNLAKEILALVKEGTNTTLDIVTALRTKDQTISESYVRGVVWQLADSGDLLLTQDRVFIVAK